MKLFSNYLSEGLKRGLTYLGIIFLVGNPLYFLIEHYFRGITFTTSDTIAFFLVLLGIAGIYIGRYIAVFWKTETISQKILIMLSILISGLAFLLAFLATISRYHLEIMTVFFMVSVYFILSMVLGLFIKLLRLKVKLQIQTAELHAHQSESELHFLQSQLSPHFLFNTLNNLYGISLTEHPKIPNLLLKLSDLLRYSVYDAKELYVPLKDELNYLQNYIEFEKIRIGDRLILSIEIDEILDSTLKIAPMLLIVFVENAFKHSKNTDDNKIFIDIRLKIWGNSLLFSINNSFQQTVKENIVNTKNSGFGLTNVKQRLELLYPAKYDLKIDRREDTYDVMLRLNVR